MDHHHRHFLAFPLRYHVLHVHLIDSEVARAKPRSACLDVGLEDILTTDEKAAFRRVPLGIEMDWRSAEVSRSAQNLAEGPNINSPNPRRRSSCRAHRPRRSSDFVIASSNT
jgi:hypothetical protein